MSSGIKLGSTFLSGVKVIAVHLQEYLPEFHIPALEGGIVERVGRKSDAVEIHGFLYSGSDVDKASLQGLIGFMQQLDVPSTSMPRYTFAGDMLIDRVDFVQPAGRQYPYYEYVIRGIFPSSGEVLFTSSGVSGGSLGIVYNQSGALRLLLGSFVDYSQVLPIFASIHPDYSQTLPTNISIHPNYSQVLPTNISIHPDYSQVLPLGASVHTNYVRIS